jgi:hypothetical protein
MIAVATNPTLQISERITEDDHNDRYREQEQPFEMVIQRALQPARYAGWLFSLIATAARVSNTQLQVHRYCHDDQLYELQQCCVSEHLEFDGHLGEPPW